MSETPEWLTAPAPAPSAMAAAPSAPAPASSNASGTPPPPPGLDASEDAELSSVVVTMRIANMGVSIALIACSILVMSRLPSVSNWVLSLYASCAGLLVCCLETQLKFIRVVIAVNFGFLFNAVYRFLFYLMMASVAWEYGTLFGRIVAGCLVGVALFNTYVLIRYPSYRKVREKIAEEEDRRIEARIKQQVTKQAMNQMRG